MHEIIDNIQFIKDWHRIEFQLFPDCGVDVGLFSGATAPVEFTKELQDGKLVLSNISTAVLDADAIADIVQVHL